jgi:hypothetical protein
MLKSFIVRYSQWRNRRALRELVPDGLIIWQWRDEYLFSTMNRMLPPDCLSAGLTRLEELGYNLIHDREYYLHSPAITKVSEEEALVQSLRVDPNNPRIPRFIKEGVQNRGANPMRILEFGKKYGLKTRLKTVVSRLG